MDRRDFLKSLTAVCTVSSPTPLFAASAAVSGLPTRPGTAADKAGSYPYLGRTEDYAEFQMIDSGLTITKVESWAQAGYGIVRITTNDGREGHGQLSSFEPDITATVLHRQVARHVPGTPTGHDRDAAPGRTEKLIPTVRKTVGDGVQLLADGNSCFTPPKAIEVGRRMEDNRYFNPAWLEKAAYQKRACWPTITATRPSRFCQKLGLAACHPPQPRIVRSRKSSLRT